MKPNEKLKYILRITDAIYANSTGIEVDYLYHNHTNNKQSRCHTALIYLTVGQIFTNKVQLLVDNIRLSDSFSCVKYIISLPSDVVIGVSVPDKFLGVSQSHMSRPILHELFTLYERLLENSTDDELSRFTALLGEISISDVLDNTITITCEKGVTVIDPTLYIVTTGKHCFEVSFYGDQVTYEVSALDKLSATPESAVVQPQSLTGAGLEPYMEALTMTGYELANILDTYRRSRIGWEVLRQGELMLTVTPDSITVPETIPDTLKALGDTKLRPVDVKISSYLHETHVVTYPLPPRENQDGYDTLVIRYENLHPPIMCSRQDVERLRAVFSIPPQEPIIGTDGIFVISETVFYNSIVNISTTDGVTPIQTSQISGKSCMFGKK